MSVPVTCPACGHRMSAPDSLAGKRTRCPQCSATVPVPAADAGFEVVADAPTRPTVVRPVAARPVLEAEDVSAPARRPRRPDDDEDDRSRRRPARDDDEDDEDDYRPRRKAKKKGVPVWVWAAAGGGLLAVVGLVVGGYFLFVVGGTFGPPPPPGYSAVGERAVGIRMFLPGQAKGSYVRKGGPDGPPDPNAYVAHSLAGFGRLDDEASLSAVRVPGFTPGTSPDDLLAAYEKAGFVARPWKYEVTSKRPVTLGGKPGLEIRVKEKPDLWDDTPDKAEFFKRSNQEKRDKVAKEGLHVVAYVVANGQWTYVITVSRKGAEPDPEKVRTVADSVRLH